jgi:putative ABC transport system permease protein
MFARHPGFTAVAVLTLALGIGANSAMFSVVNGVLLRPLPFQHPDQLVVIWEHNVPRSRPTNVVSRANFLRWREQATSFSAMGAVVRGRQNLTGAGEPVELAAEYVTANLFSLLGVQAALGRTFVVEDGAPGAPPVVLLSHRIWQQRFGGDAAVLGRTITLSDRPYAVAGVLPADFTLFDRGIDVWRPITFNAADRSARGRSLRVIGRMRPGIDPDQAHAEMVTIAGRLAAEFPDANAGWSANVVPLHRQVVGAVEPALLILLGAVGLVLLMTCSNIASLLLGRAITRQREMSIRAALGAGRARLMRQMLVESLVLSLTAGGLGLLLAAWGLESLLALVAEQMPVPRMQDIGLDRTVVAVTALVSVATGVLFGLVPAWISTSKAGGNALHDAGRGASQSTGSRRLQSGLAIAEVALALVLLVSAGLTLRSFARLIRVDTGFTADRVLTLRINLPGSKYSEDHQLIGFFEEAIARMAELPGVEAAGGNAFLPFDGPGSATSFWVDARPEPPPGEKPVTDVRVITGNYFRPMGIPLLQGRLFAGEDGIEGRRVVIVNETMVRQMFPDEAPIGKRLAVSWDEGVTDEIIGVVGDVKHQGLDTQTRPMIYWPHRRVPFNFMTLVLKTSGDPLAMAPAATAVIRALDPDQPVGAIRTLETVVGESAARPRLTSALLAVFGALAALLAVIGIYGVVSHSVAQRTREFGIRLAVGAAPDRLVRLVLRQSVGLAITGIVVGVAGAALASRLMTGLLFEISPLDPATFVGVSVLLLLAVLVASYLPARRATQVDPVTVLRAE